MPTAKSAKQKRKRCQNCNKLFVPARNVPDQKFCKDACRREFWTHGSAFGPMKAGLYRAIDKKYAALEKHVRGTMRTFALTAQILTNDIMALRQRAERLEKFGVDLQAEFERHTHGFYTTGAEGDIETDSPTEVRERHHKEWKEARAIALSNARKSDTKPQSR